MTIQLHKAKDGTRSYHAEVRLRNYPAQYASFPTKGEANAWRVDTIRRLKSNAADSGNRKGADVFSEYMRKVSPTHAGERWETLRLTALSRDPIAAKRLDAVGPADFAQFRDRRLAIVQPATVRREFTLMCSAFNVAIKEWRWLDKNPMEGVKKPTPPEARCRRVTEDEVQLLRIATGYRPDSPPETILACVQAAFELALETMMRGGEILRIRPEHIHFDQRIVHLPKTKNGSSRDVPLSNRAEEILRQVLALGHVPVFGMKDEQKDAHFRKAVTRAGITDLTFHDSRHEATTRLARKLDVLDLARMGGWRDVNVLLRVYYNATGAEIAARLNQGVA